MVTRCEAPATGVIIKDDAMELKAAHISGGEVRLAAFSAATMGSVFALFAVVALAGMATTCISRFSLRRRMGMFGDEYEPVSVRDCALDLEAQDEVSATREHGHGIYLQVGQEESDCPVLYDASEGTCITQSRGLPLLESHREDRLLGVQEMAEGFASTRNSEWY